MDKKTIFIILRAVGVIIALITCYFLIKGIIIYLYPFVIALLLTMIIHPVVTFAETRLHLPRMLASALVMAAGSLLFAGSLFLLANQLWQGTVHLARILPEHLTTFTQILKEWSNLYIIPVYEKVLSLFNTIDSTQKDAFKDQINKLLSNMSSSLSDFIQHLFLKMPATLSAFSMSFTVMIIIVLSTFFMTNDWNRFKRVYNTWMPLKMKSPGLKIWRSFLQTVFGYFKAQVSLVLITTVIIYIGLILLKVDQNLTIALLIGVVDFIPLIGTGGVFIPWIIFSFLSEQYPMTIGLSILYMVVIITRQIMEPKILSNHIGINPLVALTGLFVGIKLFGIMGLFLTPFVIIVVSTLHQTGAFKAVWFFVLYNDHHRR